jgi:hypothetical protein
VSYTLARDVGAEGERTCEDFKQFLRDIADAGIVKVTTNYTSSLYCTMFDYNIAAALAIVKVLLLW